MGVDIGTIKLGKYIKEDLNQEEYQKYEEELDGDLVEIYCEDSVMNHLTKFKKGYYEVEEWFCKDKDPYISISYSTYNDFRNQICYMANEIYDSDMWFDYEGSVDKPFAEMVCFTDCDGTFDYVVAEKLLKDFETFQEKAKKELDEWFYGLYENYMKILKNCIECKGVVRYH